MSDTFDIYKFTNENGSSKIWAIRYDSEGVTISYGKTDKVNRTTKVPLAKCAGSPATEAEKRAQKKINEGYEYQGEGIIKTGKVNIQKTANRPQKYYWEFDAGGMQDLEFDEMIEYAVKVARTIAKHDRGALETFDTGFQYRASYGKQIAFHVTDNPGNGNLSRNENRGQGVLSEDTRSIYGLFILALYAKYESRLTIANDSGTELDLSNHLWPRPELFGPIPPEALVLCAEELELKPIPVRFDHMEPTTLGEWFY